jgi:hypothetical protein
LRHGRNGYYTTFGIRINATANIRFDLPARIIAGGNITVKKWKRQPYQFYLTIPDTAFEPKLGAEKSLEVKRVIPDIIYPWWKLQIR